MRIITLSTPVYTKTPHACQAISLPNQIVALSSFGKQRHEPA